MKKHSFFYLLLLLLLALTGCGSGQDDSTGGYTASEERAEEPAGNTEPVKQTVKVMESEAAGKYLADSEGMTLYYFTNDEPDKSNCTGDCLVNWPAFIGSEIEAPEGYDENNFGVITREDNGEQQITYKGFPLYYFINDTAEGDINGQGVNDAWYIVNDTTEFPSAN